MELYKDGITCNISDNDRLTIERLKDAGYTEKEEPQEPQKTTRKTEK